MESALRIRRMEVKSLPRRRDLDRVLQALESLPIPATERIILVRHLRLHGSIEELGAELERGLRDLIASAREVRSDLPLPSTSAVWFRDRAEQTVVLTMALVTASVSRHWYLRTTAKDLLSIPAALAIARAWAREAARLPLIVARLAARGQLAPAWTALDDTGAEEVIAALIQAWRLPSFVRGTSEPLDERLAAVLRASTSPWLAALHACAAGAAPASERRTLAALLLVQQLAPAVLAEPRCWPHVLAVAHALQPRAELREVHPVRGLPSYHLGPERPLPERPPPEPVRLVRDSPWSREEPFASAFAGSALVVTACTHPALLTLLRQHELLARHGFGVWLGLCRGLGLAPDDPLTRWLEHVCRDDQPVPTGALDVLHAAARARFGEALWNPALIAIAGTFTASETHLDFYLPLSSVRLPVRLAGLDLDPGWVPWLGRVVTLHYVESAAS